MMLRLLVPAEVKQLGEHEVEIRMMTGALARDGHIIDPAGMALANYQRNPIQLWQHNPDFPVGRNEDIHVAGDSIVARTVFAPAGVSPKADEVRGLVKSGIVSAVSIGFDVLDAEPLDPKRPRGGLHITRSELLECSFVSVPADPGATVTARELLRAADADWKCGAARNLPIDDSDAWDGAAAEASIFEHAGGDDFDPAEARKGFLFYDAAKPKLRGSYRDPIAHVVGGEMKVPKGAIRAAASRLPQTDVPDAVKKTAEEVLDAYKKKAGIGEEGDRGARAPRRRVRNADRGMYGIANLAFILDMLSDAQKQAEIETAIEGDASQLPTRLAAHVKEVGATLVAMAQEEVAELIAGDDDPDPMIVGGETVLLASASPTAKRLLARAGSVLSSTDLGSLASAEEHHSRALEHHRGAKAAQLSAEDHRAAIEEAHGKAADAHAKLGEALDGASAGSDSERGANLDQAKRAHRAFGRALDAIGEHSQAAADDHQDMASAHRGIARSIKAAQRACRAIADAPAPAAADQTEDAARSADYRRRQADKLRLRAA